MQAPLSILLARMSYQVGRNQSTKRCKARDTTGDAIFQRWAECSGMQSAVDCGAAETNFACRHLNTAAKKTRIFPKSFFSPHSLAAPTAPTRATDYWPFSWVGRSTPLIHSGGDGRRPGPLHCTAASTIFSPVPLRIFFSSFFFFFFFFPLRPPDLPPPSTGSLY
jgi:hypothetical protein